jgi:hypothetical protein
MIKPNADDLREEEALAGGTNLGDALSRAAYAIACARKAIPESTAEAYGHLDLAVEALRSVGANIVDPPNPGLRPFDPPPDPGLMPLDPPPDPGKK